MSSDRDRIDVYLDELFARLRGRSIDVRRILTETEAHLRDAATAFEESGLDPDAAQMEAIRRFGDARTVARDFRTRWLPTFPVLAQLAQALAILAAVGLIAIGLSGFLADGFGAAFGKSFVSGDAPGVTYTAERCATFQRLHPEATSCAGAAVAHHFDEVVWYRVDAGILGVLALLAYLLIRRYNRRHYGDMRLLPDGFVPTLGAALFGLAAVTQLGFSAMSLIIGDTPGVGEFLAGGVVSFVAFLAFGFVFLKVLRDRSEMIAPPQSSST